MNVMLGRMLRCLVAAVIVLIASDNARAATGCDDPPEEIGNFEASSRPPGSDEPPFFAKGSTPRTLADFRGEGVVVNFWATWCAPCVVEMPALDRLAGELEGEGIAVLALSADREGASVVQRFYDVNGIANLGVDIDHRMQVSRAHRVRSLPTTLLIDADGREVGRVLGVAEWDAPETIAFLRRCLGSPPV